MRNEINLTDAEIEEQFEELGICTTIDEMAFTMDTIDDFKEARKGYVEGGKIDVDDEFAFVVLKTQAFAGKPRKDLAVIDFGSVRVVIFA